MRSQRTPRPPSVRSIVVFWSTRLCARVGAPLAGLFVRRGDDLLRAGGRGVAVLEDQQHRVVAVEQRALHAGEQPVVPEAAVADDRQRAARHHRRHAGTAGQTHAVAEDRVAEAERLEGAEGVAADVGRDVHAPHLLLRELERREHRPLGAADAEARRPRRQRRTQRLGCRLAARAVAVEPRDRGVDRMPRQVALHELQQRLRHHLDRVLAGGRQQVLAVQRRLHVAPAQQRGQLLFDELGLPFFEQHHRAFARAERHQLVGHQRIRHVEHQHRNLAGAERVGQAELLQRADQRVAQATLHDQPEVAMRAGPVFVELVLHDVAPRRRDALVALELLLLEA